MAIPVLPDSPKPGLGLGAHLPHPSGRAALQFRVVLILPGASGGLERLALLASLDLLPSYFGEKRAPPALADQPVYAGHDILGQDNVGSLGQYLCHTFSVT